MNMFDIIYTLCCVSCGKPGVTIFDCPNCKDKKFEIEINSEQPSCIDIKVYQDELQ